MKYIYIYTNGYEMLRVKSLVHLNLNGTLSHSSQNMVIIGFDPSIDNLSTWRFP